MKKIDYNNLSNDENVQLGQDVVQGIIIGDEVLRENGMESKSISENANDDKNASDGEDARDGDSENQIDSNVLKLSLEEVLAKLPELKAGGKISVSGLNPGFEQEKTLEEQFLEKYNNARTSGDLQKIVKVKRQAALSGIFLK